MPLRPNHARPSENLAFSTGTRQACLRAADERLSFILCKRCNHADHDVSQHWDVAVEPRVIETLVADPVCVEAREEGVHVESTKPCYSIHSDEKHEIKLSPAGGVEQSVETLPINKVQVV